jgi:hypothetical protein
VDGAILSAGASTHSASLALRIATTSCSGPQFRRVVGKNITVVEADTPSASWSSRPWAAESGGCYDVADYSVVGASSGGQA